MGMLGSLQELIEGGLEGDELLFCIWRVVDVGMHGFRLSPIGAADFCFAGAGGDAQEFVRIALPHLINLSPRIALAPLETEAPTSVSGFLDTRYRDLLPGNTLLGSGSNSEGTARAQVRFPGRSFPGLG